MANVEAAPEIAARVEVIGRSHCKSCVVVQEGCALTSAVEDNVDQVSRLV